MAIQDELLKMSDAQAVTVTADSTTVLDLTKDGDAKKPLRWKVRVTTTFTTSDAAVLAVALQTASASSYAQLGTCARTAIAVGTLTAGTILIDMPLPYGLKKNLKTVYTVTVGSFTAGKIESILVADSDMV